LNLSPPEMERITGLGESEETKVRIAENWHPLNATGNLTTPSAQNRKHPTNPWLGQQDLGRAVKPRVASVHLRPRPVALPHFGMRRASTCVSQGLRCGPSPTSFQQDLSNHVNPHAGFRGEPGV
jgi:hypothetical protein